MATLTGEDLGTCDYCDKRPAAFWRNTEKTVATCNQCNRDIHYYYTWRRKIREGGVEVANKELETIARRMDLIHKARAAVIDGKHVCWSKKRGRKGKKPGGIRRDFGSTFGGGDD